MPAIKETPIPYWLQLPNYHDGDSYEWTWHSILDRMMAGENIRLICMDPTVPNFASLMRWVHHKDHPERLQAFQEAQKVYSELLIADAPLIAEGLDPRTGEISMEDVQRSALRVKTNLTLAGKFNKERYGDQKDIVISHKLDLTEAIEEAERRLAQSRPYSLIEGEIVDE